MCRLAEQGGKRMHFPTSDIEASLNPHDKGALSAVSVENRSLRLAYKFVGKDAEEKMPLRQKVYEEDETVDVKRPPTKEEKEAAELAAAVAAEEASAHVHCLTEDPQDDRAQL